MIAAAVGNMLLYVADILQAAVVAFQRIACTVFGPSSCLISRPTALFAAAHTCINFVLHVRIESVHHSFWSYCKQAVAMHFYYSFQEAIEKGTVLLQAAPGVEEVSEAVLRRTFSLAAQYILLSYVLQPAKDVYSKSLQVIKQLLPLPHLRAGRLLAIDPGSLDAVPERWLLSLFVLDQSGLKTVVPDDQPAAASSQEANMDSEAQHAQQNLSANDRQQGASYQIELSDVACVKPCNDPSLPPGYAFWVSLHSRPQGLYFVAGVSEDAEGWVDALHMASYAAKQGRLQMLGKALAIASGEQQYHSSSTVALDSK